MPLSFSIRNQSSLLTNTSNSFPALGDAFTRLQMKEDAVFWGRELGGSGKGKGKGGSKSSKSSSSGKGKGKGSR